MQYLVPLLVIVGFGIVLTVGLLSVLQDLMQREVTDAPVYLGSDLDAVAALEESPGHWREARSGESLAS